LYLSVSEEGILRGAVPVKGCVVGPQPHVWISCPRRSSKGRRAESKAGISSSRTRQRLGRGPADGNRSRAVKARCGQNKQRDCGNTCASNQPRLLPFKPNHFDLSNPQPPSFFLTQRPLASHSTLFPYIQLNFPSHPTPL